jgi:hypothetical protein
LATSHNVMQHTDLRTPEAEESYRLEIWRIKYLPTVVIKQNYFFAAFLHTDGT